MSDQATPRRIGPAIATVLVVLVVLAVAESTSRVLEPRVAAEPQWGSADIDLKVEQMEQLAAVGGVDVVFLGSSIVNTGIDPAAFVEHSPWATSAYNASMPAASLRVLERWAAEVAFPMLTPRTVVIGMSSRALNDNGTNQQKAYDRYIDSRGRALHLGTATIAQRLQSTLEASSALFRVRSQMRLPFTFVKNIKAGPRGSTVTDLGYQTHLSKHRYESSRAFRRRMTSRVLNNYAVGGEELAALDAIVDAAISQGAEVYVIDMPVVESAYVGMHPRGAKDYADYEAAFARLAFDDRLQWASATSVAEHTRFFADPLHLNAKGARRLVRWMAKTVLEP
jgi:hypothetical protein